MEFYNQNIYRAYPFQGSVSAELMRAVVGFGMATTEATKNVSLISIDKGTDLTFNFSTGSRSFSINVPAALRGAARFSDASVYGFLVVWDAAPLFASLSAGRHVLLAPAVVEPSLIVDISELYVRQLIVDNLTIDDVVEPVITTINPVDFIHGYSTTVAALPITNSVVVSARPGIGAGVPGGSEDGCTCEESTTCKTATYSLGGAIPDDYGAIKLTPGRGISVTTVPSAHSIHIACTAAANTGCL